MMEGFAPGARPICVFCNAPWTDDMIRVYDIDAWHGEGSYDFGPENQTATLDITCENCNRLIYRKEHGEAAVREGRYSISVSDWLKMQKGER